MIELIKRDYKEFAKLIVKLKIRYRDCIKEEFWQDFKKELQEIFKKDNSSFSEEKFDAFIKKAERG